MADIKTITTLNGTTYNIKDNSAIANVTYKDNVVTVTKRDGTSTTFTIASGSSSYWIGTKAEYNALAKHDSKTIYITTDEVGTTYVTSSTFDTLSNNVYKKTETYSQSEINTKFTAEPDILYGTAAPASSTGKNGDIYVKYTA